jgi:hypothetical protein
MRPHAVSWIVAIAGLAGTPVGAQSSASYRVSQASFNEGGHPAEGSVLAAPNFRIKLDAIGGSVAREGLASASFRSDAGFVSGYPPPGEVVGLKFPNKTTLLWSPERSVGAYEVYRGPLAAVASSSGVCFSAAVTVETGGDTTALAPGTGYFYLVTARNRLLEEGTKGAGAGGVLRVDTTPCP